MEQSVKDFLTKIYFMRLEIREKVEIKYEFKEKRENGNFLC